MARPQLDIVQFCCPVYYAQEGESPLTIDVMRLGSIKGRIKVSYSTVSGSAVAGQEFEETSGELLFEDGVYLMTLEVVINDDDNWSPSTEFKIQLSDPDCCELGPHLNICRVKVIDDDAFPGNTHQDEIVQGEDKIWGINGLSLFRDYFRLNFISNGMAWRTALIVSLDQFKNLYLLLTLVMKTYLVNVVLDKKGSEEKLFVVHDRRLSAMIIGALYVVPMLPLHIWDYRKLSLDVVGRSKLFLQTTLFRKYLNYSESSRRAMSPAQMQLAITRECGHVATTYGAVLDILQMIGRIVLMVGFTLLQDPASWWVVTVMPILMVLFGCCRGDAMSKVAREAGKEGEALVDFISECCEKYSLIAEYNRRPAMSELFEQKANKARTVDLPEAQVALNNNYFPKWLGPAFIGAYIACFAEAVLDGTQSMGVFLAIISVINDVSGDFEGIFQEMMNINTRFDSLKILTIFFNMPSELPVLRELNLRYREMTHKAREEVMELPPPPPESGLFRTDLMKIKVTNVTFGYANEKKLFYHISSLDVQLGKVVAVVGVHGAGKNTFLRLISGRLQPTSGEIFVPTHLRALFVSQDPVLLDASVWQNLTYGAPDMLDTAMVKGVCKLLQMHKVLDLLEEDSNMPDCVQRTKSAPLDVETGARCLQLDRRQEFFKGSEKNDGSYVELLGMEPQAAEEPDLFKSDSQEDSLNRKWMDPLTYTERVKVSLARALIMNPDLLVLHRPFHHFDNGTSDEILSVIKKHYANRGVCLPETTRHLRRPRTVFFSPETVEQAVQAHMCWQIDHCDRTVREVDKRDLNGKFEPRQNSESTATGSARRALDRSGSGTLERSRDD